MAFKAINNTISPNRLVPILLIFSTYPQIVELDALCHGTARDMRYTICVAGFLFLFVVSR